MLGHKEFPQSLRLSALRVERAADHIGIRGIVVHAISPEAKTFYLNQGFKESPGDPMLLFVSMKHVRAVPR